MRDFAAGRAYRRDDLQLYMTQWAKMVQKAAIWRPFKGHKKSEIKDIHVPHC